MARHSSGYVKIHRSLFDGDLAREEGLLSLFVTLIGWANWQPRKFVFEGQQRDLSPGHVVCGINELAKHFNVSKSTIYRRLRYLEKTERIRNESGTRGTIISILNYETYQATQEVDESQAERERNASETLAKRQRTLNEEGKKVRSIKAPPIVGAVSLLAGQKESEELLKEVKQSTQLIWLKLYSPELVKRELLHMVEWLDNHPQRKGTTKFISNWLKTAHQNAQVKKPTPQDSYSPLRGIRSV